MKKLIVALIAVLMFPQPLSAGTTADITITAAGIVIGAPGGFTLTYISDYEIGIDWTKAPGAVNTMVRAAVGRYPENISDGYLVYYGNGITASDTGVSLDETAAAVYYRAWSENDEGVFSPVWAEGFMEGIGVIIVGIAALMLVAIIAMGVAWQQKAMIFAVIGTFIMMMAGFFAYTNIVTDGDLFWGFFFGCIGMALMGIIEAGMLRSKKEPTMFGEEPDRMTRRQEKQEKRLKKYGPPLTEDQTAQMRRRQEFVRVANKNQSIFNAQRRR